MKKLTRTIGRWDKLCKSRIGLVFYLSLAATLALIGFLDNPFYGAAMYVSGLLYVAWHFRNNNRFKAPLSVLLAAMMIQGDAKAAEEPPTAEAAGIAVAVVVVCVGAVCVVSLVKFCQRKFPKGTNSTSGLMFSAAADDDEYGASYNYANIGSCYIAPDFRAASGSPEEPTTVTMNIFLNDDSTVTTSTVTLNGEDTTQDFAGFQREMWNKHRLSVSGMGDESKSFSWNGVTADPSMVPITFDPFTKAVKTTVGNSQGELRMIVIERSFDMEQWSPFLKYEMSTGSGFRFVDTTVEGQMFYRVQVTQP